MSDLDLGFEFALVDQPSRHKLLAELARKGANGMIDDIAMQMIMKEPAPDAIIRRLGGAAEVTLQGGTKLWWREGVVKSLGKNRDARFRWKRNEVTLNVSVPETVCAAAKGLPVTKLVQHPALSDGMIVRRISGPCMPMTLKPRSSWNCRCITSTPTSVPTGRGQACGGGFAVSEMIETRNACDSSAARVRL